MTTSITVTSASVPGGGTTMTMTTASGGSSNSTIAVATAGAGPAAGPILTMFQPSTGVTVLGANTLAASGTVSSLTNVVQGTNATTFTATMVAGENLSNAVAGTIGQGWAGEDTALRPNSGSVANTYVGSSANVVPGRDEPAVNGGTTSVYRIGALLKGGLTPAQVRQDFPSLSAERIEAIGKQASHHPERMSKYPGTSFKRFLRNLNQDQGR